MAWKITAVRGRVKNTTDTTTNFNSRSRMKYVYMMMVIGTQKEFIMNKTMSSFAFIRSYCSPKEIDKKIGTKLLITASYTSSEDVYWSVGPALTYCIF